MVRMRAMRDVMRGVLRDAAVRLGLLAGVLALSAAPVVWAGGAQGGGPAPPAGADPGPAGADPGPAGADSGRPGAAGEPGEGQAPVPAVGRTWPVGVRPPVLRGWEPPATVYGPGHRGVDLGAPPGAPVRAVAVGRVFFAGPVAGRGVVSIELTGTGDPPLRTTYEPVSASVRKGDRVAAGGIVGTVQATGSHCGGACLHWGLLRGTVYLNPLLLLPPWLLNGPTRLLPVPGVPLPP